MNNPKVVHLLYAFERWKVGPAQVGTATKLWESSFLTPKPRLSSLQQKRFLEMHGDWWHYPAGPGILKAKPSPAHGQLWAAEGRAGRGDEQKGCSWSLMVQHEPSVNTHRGAGPGCRASGSTRQGRTGPRLARFPFYQPQALQGHVGLDKCPSP